MTDGRTRAVTREVTISAPVDAVWRAITDAEEITRWFSPEARVEPGVGGSVWRRWPSGESITERIDWWAPNAHLRTVGLDGAWRSIVTDYHLTTRGGETVLRVVSSGFGVDADWDALYDAFGGGWEFELRGLAHYLEHHRGVPRIVALVRAPRAASASESWRRIVGAGCFLELDATRVDQGATYTGRLAGGWDANGQERRDISGDVVIYTPPEQLALTVAELDDAYLRIDTRCIGETGTALVWLSTYGVRADVVAEIERAWQRVIDAAFLESEPGTARHV